MMQTWRHLPSQAKIAHNLFIPNVPWNIHKDGKDRSGEHWCEPTSDHKSCTGIHKSTGCTLEALLLNSSPGRGKNFGRLVYFCVYNLQI